MSDVKPPKKATALSGLVSGVGRSVGDRVRQELEAARVEGDGQLAVRGAAAALGGLVGGVGQNVADLVRLELGAARSEVAESARAAARGAGLLGGAAAAGHTAVLFAGVGVWQGLGSRIGFAKSAFVVVAVSGVAAAALASAGRTELARVRGASRGSRMRPATVPQDAAADVGAAADPRARNGATAGPAPTHDAPGSSARHSTGSPAA